MSEFDNRIALDAAIAASDAASEVLMSRFRDDERHLATWQKSPGALVTDADIESDRAIAEALKRSGATGYIISEESRTELSATDDKDGIRCEWLIDPLCGTVPFSTGMTHWGVNIAMRQHGGGLEVAVLSTPASGDSITVSRGEGANLNGRAFSVKHPDLRLGESAICLEIDGEHHQWEQLIDSGELKWAGRAGQVNSFSSAAYPLMQVCLGRLSGAVFYRIEPMHMAAGSLVLQELGAKVTNAEGEAIDWSSDLELDVVVAAWPGVHSELIDAIAEFRQP